MMHRLTTNYAKKYCNQTLIVKVIVENVVTCFLGTQCSIRGDGADSHAPPHLESPVRPNSNTSFTDGNGHFRDHCLH